MSIVLQVLGALVLVVVASDAFTNAVEWMGAIFGLTRSAVGSVVAAIGSSLPETMVALIALLVLHDAQSHAIGIGAVLGAPLMLSTVVFCLIGVTALSRGVKGVPGALQVPVPDTLFGTGLFCATFALALAASFVSGLVSHVAAAVLVLGAYALYLAYHLRSDKPEADESPPRLRIAPKLAQPPLALVITQLVVALVLTIVASRWFVASVGLASQTLSISPFLVSVFLTPIATELPEVSNVLLWMRRGQDELGLGNVLGAMMFQTSITCAIAMIATSWQLDESARVAAAVALLSTLFVLGWTALRRRVEPLALAAGGVFYIGYVAYVIART
ncbi:MAG: sodium:proton exchanger [Candidatus Eremiobacter antarcticus]|nr:sodium:calcium antiporter [Candidatus Eremiobacteraeota bacterium]MBC5807405.1 sodium:calcium antiporter [Candidatus Eremiobacteraeota bacterium]PZR63152.1 MAG: sodium:proton exchanger [Candidatus Eremiobacter sp. RRmetagenome_bin22]